MGEVRIVVDYRFMRLEHYKDEKLREFTKQELICEYRNIVGTDYSGQEKTPEFVKEVKAFWLFIINEVFKGV